MSLATLSFEIDGDESGFSDAAQEVERRFEEMEEQLGEVADAVEDVGDDVESMGKKFDAAFAVKAVKMFAHGIKELAGFVYESAKAAADAGSGPMQRFVSNIEDLHDAFKRVGAQAASQLAPILEKITHEFLNSKDAANALKDAGNFIASAFRVLASVGAVVIGVFDAVGSSIGAVASAIVDVLSGNFEAAADTMKANILDVEKTVKQVLGRVESIMTTPGGGDFKGPVRAPKGDGGAEARRLQKAADDAAKSVARLAEETEGWDPTADWAQFSQDYQEQLSQAPLVQASEGAFEFMANMQTVNGALAAAGQALMQAIPRLGELINAAQQGAQMGGVWGALIAVFVQLISETQGFQRIIDLVNGDLDQLIAGLEPLVDGFADLMEALDPMTNSLTAMITTLLKPIGMILKVLAPILKLILAPMNIVTFALEKVGELFDLLGQELDKFGAWIDDFLSKFKNFFNMRGFKSDAELNAEAIAAGHIGPNGEIGTADHGGIKFPEWITKATDGTKDFHDQIVKTTAALVNVPQGYKIALRRFQADVGGGFGTIAGTGAAPNYAFPGSSGVTFNGPVTVVAQNPEEFFRQLRRKGFTRTGAAFS